MAGREAMRQAAPGQTPVANLLGIESRRNGRREAPVKTKNLITPAQTLTRVRLLRSGMLQAFFPAMKLLPTFLVCSPLSCNTGHDRLTLARKRPDEECPTSLSPCLSATGKRRLTQLHSQDQTTYSVPETTFKRHVDLRPRAVSPHHNPAHAERCHQTHLP